ncbi:MAG: DUF2179 domain-containing protein [Candidatus Eisenbacteria bacterium]|nr:DUF2179 domain-containing protein [Candidatus Eisenbacteria bacterium]
MPALPTDSIWFAYVFLPLAIALARVLDVSIGTIRVILLGRGARLWAPVLGFVEILIWLMAISQIMQNLNNWICILAYAAGFAGGNFVGLLIENRLAMGLSMVRVVAPGSVSRLKRFLHKAGFGVTTLPASGARGAVEIVFTVVRRRQLPRVAEIIRRTNPRAFYTVEDVRAVSQLTFASLSRRRGMIGPRRLIPRRKGK